MADQQSGNALRIFVLELSTGKVVFQADASERIGTTIAGVSLSPDDKQLVAAFNPKFGVGTALVWDVASGEILFAIDDLNGSIADITYSPDGRRIATLSSTTSFHHEVQLWDANSGAELLSVPVELVSSAGARIRFREDGRRIAVFGAMGSFHILDAQES